MALAFLACQKAFAVPELGCREKLTNSRCGSTGADQFIALYCHFHHIEAQYLCLQGSIMQRYHYFYPNVRFCTREGRPQGQLWVDSVEKVDIYVESSSFGERPVFVFSVFSAIYIKYWLKVNKYGLF